MTAIYDFRPLVTSRTDLTDEQKLYPALVYEFEGLEVMADGSLWASIAANWNGTTKELWKLDLASATASGFLHPGSILGQSLSVSGNPVAPASIGNRLIVGHNFHGLGNLIGSVDPSNQSWTSMFVLSAGACGQLEGLAYTGGKLYAGCQSNKAVLELDPTSGDVSRTFTFADQVLGLAQTDDGRLVVGTYPSRELVVFDPSGRRPNESISLNSLFVGTGSDYYRLTGTQYSVTVVPNETARSIPDPDGLAYGNGKIYMSFDGDLRIFEISTVPEPEVYAMLLVGLGVMGRLWRRRNPEH